MNLRCNRPPVPRTNKWQPMLFALTSSLAVIVGHLEWLAAAQNGSGPPAEAHSAPSFVRRQLTPEYFSEGTNVGDLNGDQHLDVVYGPYWFAGPDYQQRHEIYRPQPQSREGYADHFFCWVYDFDQDHHQDVLVVGFPGKPAVIYRNPGAGIGSWQKFPVLPSVGNESPQFTQLVGDPRPELVCVYDGFLGYAEMGEHPLEPWKFTPISDAITDKVFGHGLGVGDVDLDGQLDLLYKDGWLQQPQRATPSPTAVEQPRWRLHAHSFAPAPSDMFAYDVDGDGDQDIVCALHAHEYGLAWFEQTACDAQGNRLFQKHLIMGERPSDNPHGLVFTELHTLRMADMNRDGLLDIVTGKTYWSHHRQSPLWDQGAVVYWFELQRGDEGQVDWIPHLVDQETGVGRQVIVSDLNADQLPDIVVGGMLGCHVLQQVPPTHHADAEHATSGPEVKQLADGLPPEQAAQHMTTLPGFHVQLAAAEPLVHQPVALTIDARGRLWIAEAYTYPQRAPEGAGKDKIIILEDRDHDRRFETRHEFATGLNLVSGLEVGHGGVWVGAAPYLLFIPDRNADDQPDGPPEIVLDGFGYHDTHETLNAFVWGPDGWLYGCHGVFTHSRVGPPSTPDEQRVPLNAGVWRYHPLHKKFQVFAWGTSNPWGLDFNEQGQAFVTACVIPHLYHMVQGGHYQRQAGEDFSPHTYDLVGTIADHLHYAGNIQDHAWWGHEPVAPPDTLSAGGGHAHCGALIYLGDNFPAAFRNQILMHNVHGNRVNQDRLVRRGSGYVGQHGPDMLLANDRWFRGINLRTGPDGSVYLIDWYDPNACHRTQPEIWDRSNGRVYNLRYDNPDQVRDATSREPVNLAGNSDEQLADYQLHPNDWYARTARRILQERSHALPQAGARSAIQASALDRLKRWVKESPQATHVLRSLWTLHVCGELEEVTLQLSHAHPDEYVRAWSVQLAVAQAMTETFHRRWVTMAAEDGSPVVRLYLASALQQMTPEQRWPIATALAAHAEDQHDHNLPAMLWYGSEPLVAADPSRALQWAEQVAIPSLQQNLVRRVASHDAWLPHVVASLAESPSREWSHLLLTAMQKAFEGRVDLATPDRWEATYATLSQQADSEIGFLADSVGVRLGSATPLPRLRILVRDPQAPRERRHAALQLLLLASDSAHDSAMKSLLPQLISDAEMQTAAIAALAHREDVPTMRQLLTDYPRLSEAARSAVINTACTRTSYAQWLVKALQDGVVARQDLAAHQVRQMVALGDADLQASLERWWGQVRPLDADRQALVADWKKRLTDSEGNLRAGNAQTGRKSFVQTCAPCHRLFDEGAAIGPDLTGSNRSNLDYLLQNIIDPSAVLGRDYRLTVVQTSDGRVVTGIVRKETDSAVTLQTVHETVIVPLREIEHRELSSLSMMPEQLLEKMSEQQVLDLIHYLGSPQQVPLPEDK